MLDQKVFCEAMHNMGYLTGLASLPSLAAVADHYMNDTLILFLGSFIVAIAVERWELHRRVHRHFHLPTPHACNLHAPGSPYTICLAAHRACTALLGGGGIPLLPMVRSLGSLLEEAGSRSSPGPDP